MAQGPANLGPFPACLLKRCRRPRSKSRPRRSRSPRDVDVATAVETALDARRQRVIVGGSQVNVLDGHVVPQAFCALGAIAIVHSATVLPLYGNGNLATG